MDLMRRLLRLREWVCVMFENVRMVMGDCVWFRKYVKPRILERGVKVDEAGLSIGGDDEAVGIKHRFLGGDECQSVDYGTYYDRRTDVVAVSWPSGFRHGCTSTEYAYLLYHYYQEK